MCNKCEKCGKARDRNSYYSDVIYDEEYDGYLCGKCSNDFAASVEEHIEHRRRQIQEDNEY